MSLCGLPCMESTNQIPKLSSVFARSGIFVSTTCVPLFLSFKGRKARKIVLIVGSVTAIAFAKNGEQE